MNAKILIIEDEIAMATILRDRLGRENHIVTVAGDGESALALMGHEHFDLLILDLMLPGKSGLIVCEDLRRSGVTTPVLILTARHEAAAKVAALRAGANDYLTKPFQIANLMKRIDLLLGLP